MKWYCMKDENTYIFSPVPLYSNYFQGTLIRSAHQIYRFCKGALVFRDGSELHFKEFIDTEAGITKYKYGYHYQKDGSLIFRYDNHPHPARMISLPVINMFLLKKILLLLVSLIWKMSQKK